MKDIFSNFFKISISTSIVFLIFGILLLFNPEGIIVTISIVIGLLLSLFGISELIKYSKNTDSKINLSIGVFTLIAGLLLIINTNILATIIPVLIGICMIILGVKKLELALNFKENKVYGWTHMMVMAVLTLVCGIIFVINPIKGAFLATQVLGIIIIIYSLIDITDSVILKEGMKKIKKIIEEK